MGKLTDLLGTIASKIGSNELKDIAQNNGIAEIDIDEGIFEAIDGKFKNLLTLDAARNNPELVEKIKEELKPQMKKSLLTNIDETLNTHVGKFLSEDQIQEITGIERTNDRLGKFFEYAEMSLKEGSKDSKLKEINEQLKKQISDLNANFKTELAKREEDLKKLDTGYKSKLINNGLDSILSKYSLGEDYEKDFVKKALFADIKEKVHKSAKLKLGDDGNIIPKNPENDELDLFIDNKKIDNVQDVIEPLMKPYLKKKVGTTTTPGAEYTPAPQTDKQSRLAQDIMERKRQANLI